jgi:beta-lactam-binding protein with PASTA domain
MLLLGIILLAVCVAGFSCSEAVTRAILEEMAKNSSDEGETPDDTDYEEDTSDTDYTEEDTSDTDYEDDTSDTDYTDDTSNYEGNTSDTDYEDDISDTDDEEVVQDCTVPDVIGMTLSSARDTIANAGLRLTKYRGSPGATKVSSQNPGAGAQVRCGAGVQLTLIPPTCTVPNVIGMTVSSARNTIANAGLGLAKFSVTPGATKVSSQNPRAGAQVRCGTKVQLRFAPPTPRRRSTQINWNSPANSFRGRNGAKFSFVCPPNGRMASVWGSNPYTDDSSICTAAVHAGVITFSRGGVVEIIISKGARSYPASTANGVTTQEWGRFEGSFIIR